MRAWIKKIDVLAAMIFATALVMFAVSPAGADTVVYSEGFESDNGGYQTDGYGGLNSANWEWGSPTDVGPLQAHSGTKCWGTDLNANPPSYTWGSIASPVIPVPALGEGEVLRVRFFGYVDVSMEARARFQVSSDGLNWETLADLYMNMQSNSSLPGQWNNYEFGISEYADGPLYLRFYIDTDEGDKPGFYIDDVAVTIYSGVSNPKILTLEANEDNDNASCPWVFPWDGTEFLRDNDIYSVARTAQGEYRDYYLLQKPLVLKDGTYRLEVREIESENSWTDMVGLVAVDHAVDVSVCPDDKGNVFAYSPAELIPPVSAVDAGGADVLGDIAVKDDNGYPAYSEGYINLDFGNVDVSAGARLVLRVKGFISGDGANMSFIGPPAIVVQALAGGAWQEVGRLKPRFEWSECVFDVGPCLAGQAGDKKLRLYSISHARKYHEIDFAGLSIGPAPEIEVSNLSLLTAVQGSDDVRSALAVADNVYVAMQQGNAFSVAFASAPQSLAKRDFIFVSEGYYVPDSNTFFIYTWDGSNWVMRDGYSFPFPFIDIGDGYYERTGPDTVKNFDLSLFLPDPDGEYKVRIWQDFMSGYGNAAIDYISLNVGDLEGTLDTAIDLRYGVGDGDGPNVCGVGDALPPDCVWGWVSDSDNIMFDIAYWDTEDRNRWSEYSWTELPVNRPPTTNPVWMDGNTINWTYNDNEEDPQVSYEIEIWTGTGGTGENVWDPPADEGTAESAVYSGDPLPGGTYYVRVKAYDGNNWGAWSEAEWILAENLPPTANAGPDATVKEGEPVTLDGSGSTDPDDGIASYLWEQISGPPVTIENADQAIAGFTAPQIGPVVVPEPLYFRLTVTDVGGLSDSNVCKIDVVNNIVPVADAGADQAVMEIKQVTLDGSGSHDPDGVIVSYLWEQTKGPAVTIADPSAATTTFFTPGYEEGNDLLEFTLTVTDDGGFTGQDTCVVTVIENMPPEIPVQTGPADGELFGSDEPITLTSSPYSDPEGNPHVETSWMIRRIDRPTYDYQHISVTELEEYVVTGLPSGLQYAWMVGYKDMGSKRNSWSVDEWTFTVGTFAVDASVKVPTGWGINDYLMVSFTIWPEDPAATSVFGIAPDTTRIRIGTYDPTLGGTGGYLEYGDPDLFVKPGTSYWFLVKGGITPVIDGIPVSLDVDIDVPLLYNTTTANGWNMIAAPNNADYKWDDVEVLEYDATGAVVQGPIRMEDLSHENTMIDKRLWRWESGAYASDTAEIEKHSGYWLKAKRANVWLRFPADAHLAAKGVTEFYASLMMKEAAKMAKAWGITPAYAATDTSDTPPMPMGGFTDTGSNPASSSKEGGGGCFVNTVNH